MKLSWELLTPFSEFLRALPTQQNRAEEDEDEDEDELQAHEDIMQRLRVRYGSVEPASDSDSGCGRDYEEDDQG